jgi:hypothetical protein
MTYFPIDLILPTVKGSKLSCSQTQNTTTSPNPNTQFPPDEKPTTTHRCSYRRSRPPSITLNPQVHRFAPPGDEIFSRTELFKSTEAASFRGRPGAEPPPRTTELFKSTEAPFRRLCTALTSLSRFLSLRYQNLGFSLSLSKT